GLTYVCAGSVNAHDYGLDGSAETLARALDGVVLDAGIAIDFNASRQARNVIRHFSALVKGLGIAPDSIEMRAGINPIGGLAATGNSPHPWPQVAEGLAELVDELAGLGF